MENRKKICGISVCNPFDVEEEYVGRTVAYAVQKGFNHIQFIGPIHHPVKGNIDGMTWYRKYARFNGEKDKEYVERAQRVLNAACRAAREGGVKTYVWHHELELPAGFAEAYPEILNDYRDVEVSSPRVRDFLEQKILDFFAQYPEMDGIILTLHETSVPLLKLKHQKLSKTERVRYVVRILYEACKSLGKDLVVRPFASTDEDYDLMMEAYEAVSGDMTVMDKWTQFDWSLCLPHNRFFNKIQKNPLLVEADIFGEFFGKGRLPLLLREHILDKYRYCESFRPEGYCFRIDRSGEKPFGDVNEVNLEIACACVLSGDGDAATAEAAADAAIDAFFAGRYGAAGQKVRRLMEPTEGILRKLLYLNGYYYTELSVFPGLNHCKNHFYFEIMREEPQLVSGEWFIPKGWQRGPISALLAEKDEAVREAERVYDGLREISGELSEGDYEALRVKFCNLVFCAKIWRALTDVFLYYTKYFECSDEAAKEDMKEKLDAALCALSRLDEAGKEELGDSFYCVCGQSHGEIDYDAFIPRFIREVRESFRYEQEEGQKIEGKYRDGLVDYVICGGACEGHSLQKEVNFSDTMMRNGRLCRIAGSARGMDWCSVNGHGWFSYLLKVEPGRENRIRILCGSGTDELAFQVTVGQEQRRIQMACGGEEMVEIPYTPGSGERAVRVRFDKVTKDVPCIYTVEVIRG